MGLRHVARLTSLMNPIFSSLSISSFMRLAKFGVHLVSSLLDRFGIRSHVDLMLVEFWVQPFHVVVRPYENVPVFA